MVWDMDAPASKAPIRLVGHRGEVGAVAWGNEMVRTALGSYLVLS